MSGRDGCDDAAAPIREAFESAIDLDAIDALDDETVEKLIAMLDHAEDRRER
jgi:hypothetical protein